MKKPKHARHSRKYTRPPYDRMARIHAVLLSDKLPTCTSLGRVMEVSPKTIQRDLEFMRDRLGLPLAYDRSARGYRYTEAVEHFPMVEVTEGEVFALFVAQKVMAQYQGTPFEQLLAQSFEKMAGALQENVGVPLFALEDAISFKSSGTADVDLNLFRALHQAVVGRHEVHFRYKRRGKAGFDERRVQPYVIHGALNAWYLIGYDKDRGDFRVFALHRISKLGSTKNRFERQKGVSPESLLKDSLGVFIGNERHQIRVRFAPFAAELVRERRWHDSQELTELSGDEVELRMTLSSLFEVEQWILSWGSQAEVLEPPELRERVAQHAKTMGAVYAPDR